MGRPAVGWRGVTNKGIGISAQFIRKREVNLTGQKVNNPRDVVALAQVFRDPRYETFRFIYTKGNTVEDIKDAQHTVLVPEYILCFPGVF